MISSVLRRDLLNHLSGRKTAGLMTALMLGWSCTCLLPTLIFCSAIYSCSMMTVEHREKQSDRNGSMQHSRSQRSRSRERSPRQKEADQRDSRISARRGSRSPHRSRVSPSPRGRTRRSRSRSPVSSSRYNRHRDARARRSNSRDRQRDGRSDKKNPLDPFKVKKAVLL